MKFLVFLTLAVLSLAGCGGGDDTTEEVNCEPTFASIQSTIFQAKCSDAAQCHGGSNAKTKLVLIGDGVEAAIVDKASPDLVCTSTIVTSGQPDASLLYKKVKGNAGCGVQMPQGGAPLSEKEVSCIRDWISSLK